MHHVPVMYACLSLQPTRRTSLCCVSTTSSSCPPPMRPSCSRSGSSTTQLLAVHTLLQVGSAMWAHYQRFIQGWCTAVRRAGLSSRQADKEWATQCTACLVRLVFFAQCACARSGYRCLPGSWETIKDSAAALLLILNIGSYRQLRHTPCLTCLTLSPTNTLYFGYLLITAGAKLPGGPENLLVASHNKALHVYRGNVLCWAARTDTQPVAVRVADIMTNTGQVREGGQMDGTL
jgi:hypothetical protein